MKDMGKRALGLACLFIVCFLCVWSLNDAPRNWCIMPPTEYVAEHPEIFENKSVYVDGMISDLKKVESGTVFYLSPFNGLLRGLKVESGNRTSLQNGMTGVNVYGKVVNCVLSAERIRTQDTTAPLEFFFNAAGLFFFILIAKEEWRVKKGFPYLEER